MLFFVLQNLVYSIKLRTKWRSWNTLEIQKRASITYN